MCEADAPFSPRGRASCSFPGARGFSPRAFSVRSAGAGGRGSMMMVNITAPEHPALGAARIRIRGKKKTDGFPRSASRIRW